MSISFSKKACLLASQYLHIYGTKTTWSIGYKEMAICICAAIAKLTWTINLQIYCS